MQPNDQDELRRQAQRVLTRRITASPETDSRPAREAERPRPVRQSGPARRPEQPRPRRSEERLERQPSTTEGEPRVLETIEPQRPSVEESRARADRRRAARQEAEAFEREAAARRAAGLQQGQIRRALHSRNAIRQAIVLNEILGKPVSLRDPGEGASSF